MNNDIKQSVINTFKRNGIPYETLIHLSKTLKPVPIENRFSGEIVYTTYLVRYLIGWVYSTSNDYENGTSKVTVSDFDRIRYFILEQDKQAYMTCID